ncbi:MAG: hypothetical protein LQ346_000355 [Caloplaca aetnensis]|nr:MAG: hypothetical protein LQ346_000355 [Caloplaca aetnensis]
MPFRDKVKKAFGKSNDDPSETSSDLSPTRSKASTKKPKKQKVDYPDNVYKPGEIPESKYKGPYDKKHQQKLHAFSFAAAFQGRRKSAQSLYSPMGSRLPSRMGSLISRRSWVPRSRQQSRVDDTLMENSEADDAVENVGMSRRHTREEAPSDRNREDTRPQTIDAQPTDVVDRIRPFDGTMMDGTGQHTPGKGINANGYEENSTSRMDGLESTRTLANDDYRGMSFGQPFSADDLVRAMTKSTLQPSAVQA